MKDNKNDLISPEIVKLTEKMAKDPASTLFLPLAEEYRKCGMIDEAIILLTDGLKYHPNFLSARVSLGKIYLQKGLIPEAKSEFEKVIQSTPDNLLAQKKLAIIYRDEGNVDVALESCRKLLLLNPNDEEIKKIKSELEVKVEKTVGIEMPHGEKDKKDKKKEEPIKSAPVIEETTQADESIVFNPEEMVTEKAEGKEIEFESSPVYEIKDEDIDIKEIFQEGPETTSEAEKKDMEDKTEKDSALSDIFKITPEEEEKEEKTPVYEITDTDEEVTLDNILVGREKIEEASILKKETSINDQPAAKEVDEEEAKADLKIDKKDRSIHEEIASEALAELYIKQEHFDKAIEILKILLDKDPFNEALRQKMEDAVTLKNLMGGEVLEEMFRGHDTLKEEPLKEESLIEEEEIGFSEPAGEVLESSKTTEGDLLEAISAEGQEGEAGKTKKIKRLEQWLENIKRSHGK